MPDLTHRDYCHRAAWWLLNRRATLATFECQVDQQGDLFYPDYGHSFGRKWDWKPCQVDAIAITLKSDPRLHEIAVAEVKLSRADLLADLRARKMCGYGRFATHLFLMLAEDAMLRRHDGESHAAWARRNLDDLTRLGLPPVWGVLMWSRPNPGLGGGICDPRVLRPVKRQLCVERQTVERIFRNIGSRLSYRMLAEKVSAA